MGGDAGLACRIKLEVPAKEQRLEEVADGHMEHRGDEHGDDGGLLRDGDVEDDDEAGEEHGDERADVRNEVEHEPAGADARSRGVPNVAAAARGVCGEVGAHVESAMKRASGNETDIMRR